MCTDETTWDRGALLLGRAQRLLDAGRLLPARAVASKALALLDAVFPDGHPDAAHVRLALGSIRLAQGHPKEALRWWRAALQIFDRFRDEVAVAPLRMAAHRRLGHTLTLAGEYEEAEVHITALYDEAIAHCGEVSLETAAALNLRGVFHKLQGQWDEAASAYAQAGDVYARLGQPVPVALIHNQAGLACARGDAEGALVLARRAVALRRAAGPPGSLGLGTDLAGLGDALAKVGQSREAVAAYREALAVFARSGFAEHPEVACALHNLADALVECGDLAEAERCCRESIERKERAFGPAHHEMAASLHNLAWLMQDTGRMAEARLAAARALQIVRHLAPDHPVRRGCEALTRCEPMDRFSNWKG
jgi:tetratricopeptide (TPR) repeat protein